MFAHRFSNRGTMVLGGFIGCLLCYLVIINQTLIALKYQEILEHSLIPKLPINRRERNKLIFKQDNELQKLFHASMTCFVSRLQSHRKSLGNDGKRDVYQ